MARYYENLDDLIKLVKQIEKKSLLAEFILSCILLSKENPNLSPHEIIKISKEKWNI
jgi:hypothetical protein